MAYKPEPILQGPMNARDLGGIKTASGKQIAKGRLIRSGQLSKLTQYDKEYLARIKLRTVIDLRTETESMQKPDCVLPGVEYIPCRVVDSLLPGITREAIEDPYQALGRNFGYKNQLGSSGKARMRGLYPFLVSDENAICRWREFFQVVLADREGALVYHCTMGKDRAGTATALLLYALGVPVENIIEDYMYTAICCRNIINQMTEKCREYTDDDEIIRSVYWLNTVDESYIGAVFAETVRQSGSTEKFLERRLGLDKKAIKRLESLYLE